MNTFIGSFANDSTSKYNSVPWYIKRALIKRQVWYGPEGTNLIFHVGLCYSLSRRSGSGGMRYTSVCNPISDLVLHHILRNSNACQKL